MNEAHILLRDHLEEMFPRCVREEFRFHAERKWRFDFAVFNPTLGGIDALGIELDGGIYSRGRHVRPVGYQRDLEKINTAVSYGWFVMRFSTQDVLTGKDLEFLKAWKERFCR